MSRGPELAVWVSGPPVSTAVAPAPASRATLLIVDATDPIRLDVQLVADLFALGLNTPTPDRTGWVTVGEPEITDISFFVGVAEVGGDLAMHAVGRGIERALQEALTPRRDEAAAQVGGDDDVQPD
jgi:hypothetical protein